jgi:hypothetical protein
VWQGSWLAMQRNPWPSISKKGHGEKKNEEMSTRRLCSYSKKMLESGDNQIKKKGLI